MEKLIFHCNKVLRLIDKEYPYEKRYSGIIKKIYNIISQICIDAKNNVINDNEVDFTSLIINFVDDTTDYLSPIIFELEAIKKIMSTLKN